MSEERILWGGVKAVTGVTGPARQRTSHGDDEGVLLSAVVSCGGGAEA